MARRSMPELRVPLETPIAPALLRSCSPQHASRPLAPHFSPPSAPHPADLRTSVTVFAGARFLASYHLPVRTLPLHSLGASQEPSLFCLLPRPPARLTSSLAMRLAPLSHPVIRSPLCQGVGHTILPHFCFVKLYLNFFPLPPPLPSPSSYLIIPPSSLSINL